MTVDEKFVTDHRQQMAELYRQLGERYYAAHREEAPAEFLDLFMELKSHETAIEAYEAVQRRAKELAEKGLILCPFCGEEIVNRSVFCNFCGKRLSDYVPEQQEEPAVEEPVMEEPVEEEPVLEESAEEERTVCRNCGADLEEGCVFCMECGTPVAREASDAPATEKTETLRTCEKCGYQTADSTAMFCNNCGARLPKDGAAVQESRPQEKRCPLCGFCTTEKDVLFCIECGSRLV